MAKEFCQVAEPILNLKIDSNTPHGTVTIWGNTYITAEVSLDVAAANGKVVYLSYNEDDPALGSIGWEGTSPIDKVVIRLTGDPMDVTVLPSFSIINGLPNGVNNDLPIGVTQTFIVSGFGIITQDYARAYGYYDNWVGIYGDWPLEIPNTNRQSGLTFDSLVDEDGKVLLCTRLS